MRDFVRLGFVCALFAGAAGAASAQNHSECWYVQKSGYNVRGTQPSSADIWAAMKDIALRYNIPVELLAAISYQESNWTQFASDGVVLHNKTNCTNLYRTGSLSLTPPDVGLMQLFAATARQFDIQRLITDWRYNLECGARVLDEKWRTYFGSIAPRWYPGRTNDHDRKVLENWWYPLKMYNWGSPVGTDYSYVGLIYSHIENTPAPMGNFLVPVRITRPAEAIPGYTLPAESGKYITWFKAYADNRVLDGTGVMHSARTHPGSFGERTVTAIAVAPYRAGAAATVRKGPGTEFALLASVGAGTAYMADATAGGWNRIWFNGGRGWVSTASFAKAGGLWGVRVNRSSTSALSAPSWTATVLGWGLLGQQYVRTATSGTWSQVRWNASTAWMASGALTATLYGSTPPPPASTLAAYRCTTSSLNVRGGPGTSYAILGTIPLDSRYVSDAAQTGWLRIFYNGASGWVSGTYMSKITGVTGVKVTADILNVRTGASTSYAILGQAKMNQVHVRKSTSGGWHEIDWGGRTGWVNGSYTVLTAF